MALVGMPLGCREAAQVPARVAQVSDIHVPSHELALGTPIPVIYLHTLMHIDSTL